MTRIISKEQALAIARRLLSPVGQSLMDAENQWGIYKATDKPNERMALYQTWEDEPVWYVYLPWGDGFDGSIRSSRVVLISKKDGRVVYDGSAGDEG